MLADLEIANKRVESLEKQAKGNDKEAMKKLAAYKKITEHLGAEKMLATLELNEEERGSITESHFLTLKPMIYVVNVAEADITKPVALKGVDPKHITQICVKLEAELVSLSETEIREYLDTLGVNHTGLEQLILAGYQVLDLITFLTTGEKETRAWTVKRGSTAPQAAGKIHSDFEKGFIVADTVNWKALLDAGGWTHAREQGLIRNEGKSYIVQDGDVMIFRFDKK